MACKKSCFDFSFLWAASQIWPTGCLGLSRSCEKNMTARAAQARAARVALCLGGRLLPARAVPRGVVRCQFQRGKVRVGLYADSRLDGELDTTLPNGFISEICLFRRAPAP